MKLNDIKLHNIDFKDERFRISCHPDLDKLSRSISEIGLLNPPLVTPRVSGLVIVTGWKRIFACRELSLLSIPCFILDEASDLLTFRVAIRENLSMRDFSLLEIATVLHKLKSFGEEEEVLVNTYLPLLGIPQTLSHLHTYLAIAELDAETRNFIQEKKTPYPVIRQLIELDKDERSGLLPHMRHLGRNKQREFLEFLLEISKRDNISVTEILAFGDIADTEQSTVFSPPQKANKIRILLRKMRYPFLSSREDAFRSSLKAIEWPKDISIDSPPFFEEEGLTVRFAFKDGAEFREKVHKLSSLASEGLVSTLLESVSDD